jgi:uncharacterized RDD family membrane protein YckC
MLAPPTFFLFGYMLACLGVGPDIFEDTEPIGSVLGFAYIFLYFFLSEMAWQRTPAKFITGTKVITYEGTKPTAGSIALRTLARFVPFEAISFLDCRVYGWHDKWSRTFVVRSRRLERGTHSSTTRVGDQSGRLQATIVVGSRFEAEGATSISQDSKESPSLAALLKRECSEKGGAIRQTVEQTEALAEYSQDSDPIAAEQVNTARSAHNEEPTCDAMAGCQTTGTNKEQELAKWLLLALAAVIGIAVIIVHFSNTPADTRANQIDFVPLQQQRDLTTPSSRLVGRWESVHNNGEEYTELCYSRTDPDMKIGTYRIHNRPGGVLGPPFRFKISFEEPSGNRIVLRDFNDSFYKFSIKYGGPVMPPSRDVVITIPKHGMSMTMEYDSESLTLYHYVDEQLGPGS